MLSHKLKNCNTYLLFGILVLFFLPLFANGATTTDPTGGHAYVKNGSLHVGSNASTTTGTFDGGCVSTTKFDVFTDDCISGDIWIDYGDDDLDTTGQYLYVLFAVDGLDNVQFAYSAQSGGGSGGFDVGDYRVVSYSDMSADEMFMYQIDLEFITSPLSYFELRERDHTSETTRMIGAVISPVSFDVSAITDYHTGVDLISSLAGEYTSTSSDSTICYDCSRIVDIDPADEEVSTSTSQTIQVDIYLNENDIPVISPVRLEVILTRFDGQQEIFEKEVTDFEGSSSHFFTSEMVTEIVTYSYIARIYQDIFWDFDLGGLFFTYFYAGTTTPWSDTIMGSDLDDSIGIVEGSIGAIDCSFDFPIGKDDFVCMGKYILAIIVPPKDVFGAQVKDLVQTFLLLPPWGYASQAYLTLLNPATTTVPDITLSFATTSPVHGISMTLDPADGLSMFQAQTNATATIAGVERTYYDHIMFYWEWLLNILFFIWLLKALLGMGISIERSREHPELKNSGELNMKKPRSGTIDVKRG